jgi:hypothetical protein
MRNVEPVAIMTCLHSCVVVHVSGGIVDSFMAVFTLIINGMFESSC